MRPGGSPAATGSRRSRCAISPTPLVCGNRLLYVYFDSKLDLYDAMFADGWRQFLDRVRHDYPEQPAQALAQFVGECVQFSSDDVVRHQLLLQRNNPGFEPSPESFAVAMEFFEFGSDLIRHAGVYDSADIDMFTAIVTGLAHQQVANEPGGTRWARLADRTVGMPSPMSSGEPRPSDPSRTRRKTLHQSELGFRVPANTVHTTETSASTQGGNTMSAVITQQWDAVTPAQYDQIREIVGWDVDVPAGMTFHVASFEGDILRMLDIWDFEEQFMTFVQTRIMPAVAQVGLAGTTEHDRYAAARCLFQHRRPPRPGEAV